MNIYFIPNTPPFCDICIFIGIHPIDHKPQWAKRFTVLSWFYTRNVLNSRVLWFIGHGEQKCLIHIAISWAVLPAWMRARAPATLMPINCCYLFLETTTPLPGGWWPGGNLSHYCQQEPAPINRYVTLVPARGAGPSNEYFAHKIIIFGGKNLTKLIKFEKSTYLQPLAGMVGPHHWRKCIPRSHK